VDWVKNLVTGLTYTVTTDYTVDLSNGIVTFSNTPDTENFTGTGSQTVFTLTNSNRYIVSITVAGTPTTDYIYNIVEKTVTFAAAPAGSAAIVVTETKVPVEGTDSIEIAWTCGTGTPSEVRAMKYSELYNGSTDNRVFLYGDGSNTAFYSGLDYDGNPTAEYFPDLNEMEVGDTATPVTGLLRHYNRLLAFKEDCVFTISYGTITLTDGTVTAGFYLSPVNKGIGNCAPGQACLVENYPRSLDGRSVYEWKPAGTGTITNDQRNARRISQRVEQTLATLDLTAAITYFDKINHEYYLMQDETMLVHNTENDTWYIYQDLPATCMAVYRDEVYFGTGDGYIRHFSRDYMHDNGEDIQCYWESGSMDFGLDFKRKYSANLWVGIKPEEYGAINVTVQTDKKTDYVDEAAAAAYTEGVLSGTVAGGFFSFLDLDFTRLSFGINDKPQLSRLKIKARKFAYYKLLFSTVSSNTTATVTSADIRVRYAGNVR
jgi:hypothetical protein